jgi:hypothetical protein
MRWIKRRDDRNYEPPLLWRLGEFFPVPMVELHLLREIDHGIVDRIAESRYAT